MNNYVFNTTQRPLNVTGTVVVPGASDYFVAASAGNAYMASASYSAVALALVSFAVQIANPSNSGSTIYIDTINFSNTGARVLDAVSMYAGGTLTAGLGTITDITPVNVKIGATNVKVAVVKRSVGLSITSPLSGGTLIQQMTSVASLYGGVYADTLILTPGNSVAIIATSSGLSLAASLFVRINYWEQVN